MTSRKEPPSAESIELFSRSKPVDVDANEFLNSLNFDDLDITNASEDVNLEEIDELMERFKEDPGVQEFTSQELDVRKFSQNIERKMDLVEKKSVEDYIRNQDRLANLHLEIKNCDSILESMESILNRFQFDLGNISDEIRSLQDQSSTMSVKLQNRKAVSEELKGAVTNIYLPKKLISAICTKEKVTEAYLEHLIALNQKITFCNKQGKNIAATKDVEPELQKLRIKAVAKVREYLLDLIYNELRKPNTNVQIQQQAKVLNSKYFNEFLQRYGGDYAKEVRDAYIKTMQRIYFSHFKEYASGLMKLLTDIGSKNDLLGVPENQGKGFFSSRFAKNRTNVFSLGDPSRSEILSHLSEPCIVLHDAQVKKQVFPYDVAFRSLSHYFSEAVTSEHFIDLEFFGSQNDLYVPIFQESASFLTENLTTNLAGSYDAIGILVMMKMASHYASVAKSRNITHLADHFSAMLELMRPRFLVVFNLHLESIRTADPKQLDPPSNNASPSGLPSATMTHYVTRRYAEFAAAIHSLLPGDNNQAIAKKLAALRTQMLKLVCRLCSLLPKQKQNVFLINNIDSILSIFNERGVESEDVQKWKTLMDQQIASFVEAEINIRFKQLSSFLNSIPPNAANYQFNRNVLAEVVKNFSSTFQQTVDAITKENMRYFSNWLTATNIFLHIGESIVKMYTRFDELVSEYCKEQGIEFIPVGIIKRHIMDHIALYYQKHDLIQK